MADETSSIALQLNVQLRGLVNLTKLNTALVDLKRNARGFQQDLGKGNATLGNVGKKAKEAADGLSKLTKANRDLAKSVKTEGSGQSAGNINDHMAGVFRKVQQKTFDDASRAASRTNTHMANQFKALQKNMVGEATRGAKARAAQEAMYARLFDQSERKTEASARRTAAAREVIRRREIAGLQRVMQQRKYLDDMEKTLTGRLRKYEEQNDAIFRAGFRLQMLGNDMEALGRKAAGALVTMSKEFGNFEFMVNRAAGATGIMSDEVDEGVNIYRQFSESILDATQELRLFDPTEVAKATYFWASTSGQQIDNLRDLESVMQSINPLMKIAAMTETSYETAIKGVYSILVQYGLGLEHVQDVTEKLHMVTQRTAAEFPDLINSFKMVGPVAKEFGVTFDDMVVLLGRLADAGVRGTMTGRAFRQFFIQISRPAPKATAALEELWASSEKFGKKSYLATVFPRGEFIGVNEYVEELAKRLQFASQKQRMFTLATITTANELPVLTALVSKQISELNGLGGGWDKSKEDISDAAEGFAQSWEKLRSSWNGTLGALTTGVEILRIKVGERIAKIFTPVLEKVITQLVKVRKWFADEANGPIVDFFVKLAGFGAVALTLAGALTVFVGVMVAVTAASRVAFRAFSPLFGLFGKIGGVFAGMAVAVIRNFEYIKGVFEEAADIIGRSMKENEKSVHTFTEAIGAFANVFAPVFDAVIRIFGELLLVGARVTAWILKNEGAVNVLTIAANVLGGIIAGKLVLGMAAWAISLVRATAAVQKLRAALVIFNVQMIATKVNTASLAAGGGLAGLRSAVLSLVSPLGLVGAALAAVASVFLIAYANSDKFRAGVDRFVFEFVTSLREVQQAAKDARDELGRFGGAVDKTFATDKTYQGMKSGIESLRAAIAKDNEDGIIWGADGSRRQLDIMEKDFAAYTERVYGKFKSHVADLNSLGSEVDLSAYMERLTYEADMMGVSINNSFARAKTDMWFRGFIEDSDEANAKARALIKSIGDVGEAQKSTRFNKTSDAERMSALMDLQNSGKLTGEYAREVTRQIEAYTAAGVDAVEPPEAEVAKMWGGVADTLINQAKSVFDIGNQIAEIIKNAVSPRKTLKHLREHTLGLLKKGFDKLPPEAVAAIAAFYEDFAETNQQYALLMTPADYRAYATGSIRGFLKDYKDGWPADMPPEIQKSVEATILSLYKGMGYTEIPQEVLDILYGRGTSVTGEFSQGLIDPQAVSVVTTNAGTVRDAAEAGLKPTAAPSTAGSTTTQRFYDGLKKWAGPVGTVANTIRLSTHVMDESDKSYNWGYHLGKNMADGLRSTFTIVDGAARYIGRAIYGPLHQSVADYGPLKDTDVWGLHLGQNIADGMNKSVSTVRTAAMNVANAAAMANTYAMDNLGANGISVESNANRLIKVQVEVTSPDGSVDRLKAAELERGLMTSDLILSIEHMAMVG